MDPSLERLRLEDIDISTAEGYPRLGTVFFFGLKNQKFKIDTKKNEIKGESAGNYESNPPMPRIGDDGHTGVGEGIVSSFWFYNL